MLNIDLPVSLQFQLKTKLYEKINSGEWPEGYKIPSESELCAEYGISRTTVRAVLNEMVLGGMLVRRQGKGSFVSKPAVEIALTSTYSIAADLKSQGRSSEFILLSFRRIEPYPSSVELFQMAPTEVLFEIIRLRTIEEKIFAWEKEMVPEKHMPAATAETIDKNGLYPTIRAQSGLVPRESEERIEAVICPEPICREMKLPPNSAVMKIKRSTRGESCYISKCESYVYGQRLKVRHIMNKVVV